MGIDKLWWPLLAKSCWVAMGFPLSLLRAFMLLFLPTFGCCFPPSLWWRMLGSRWRRRWRWWTFLHMWRMARSLGPPSLSLPRKVMTLSRLVLVLFHIREAFPESSPLPFAHTRSSRCSIASKPKPFAPRPSVDVLPFSRSCGSKGRHLH